MKKYSFADLHCHPNLKSFGRSFPVMRPVKNSGSDIWKYDPPGPAAKILNALTGLVKFSQTDMATMAKGNVRVAFVSFYPFEKNYFTHPFVPARFSAQLADVITGVGVKRVQTIQRHLDYWEDLQNEMDFFLRNDSERRIDGKPYRWKFARHWNDVEEIQKDPDCIAVIPTIEGAHVLNTGLGIFGRPADPDEVIRNVHRLKQLPAAPFFITFAHNFDNELCGHARSLEKIKWLTDQRKGLNEGFTPLGKQVAEALLDPSTGGRVLIDVKHMSLEARMEYYDLIETRYPDVPIVVSHGAVAGQLFDSVGEALPEFCEHEINFYDEELVAIARSGGIFGVQMDGSRLVPPQLLRKSLRHTLSNDSFRDSAALVWNQIRHIAEVLDQNGLPAWNLCSIGSDFDGTINPLNGIWTSEDYQKLAGELVRLAEDYLNQNPPLIQPSNRNIHPEELVNKFAIQNALLFLEKHYGKRI